MGEHSTGILLVFLCHIRTDNDPYNINEQMGQSIQEWTK